MNMRSDLLKYGEAARCVNTTRPLTPTLPTQELRLTVNSIRTCSIDGCDKKHRSRGWCSIHYQRWLRDHSPICSIDGCDNPARKRGWCETHYARWRKHGDVNVVKKPARHESPTCSIDGCDNPTSGHGWCTMHYKRWHRYGDPNVIRTRASSTCSIEGCDRKCYGRGWCHMHYQRWRRNGDANTVIHDLSLSTEQRFWQNVDKTAYCWIWTAFCNRQGYGKFKYPNGQLAHRYSYELHFGPIPDELTIDHRCFNPACVRPDHLQVMTHVGNAKNQRRAHATHCAKGHEYTEANTLMVTMHRPSGAERTARRCRRCKAIGDANRKRRLKAARHAKLTASVPHA